MATGARRQPPVGPGVVARLVEDRLDLGLAPADLKASREGHLLLRMAVAGRWWGWQGRARHREAGARCGFWRV